MKKFTFDRILNELEKYPYGISRKKIAENMGINVSTMAYYWNKLRKTEQIKRIGSCLFVRGEKTSVEPALNIHAIQLTFPILSDNSTTEFWDKSVDMGGWTAYYKSVQTPIGLTIQKNTKYVQVQVWARDVAKPEDVESLMLRAAFYAWHYLKEKAGVEVDIFRVQKKNVDIAVRDATVAQVIGTKDKIEVDLGRPIKKIFEADAPKPAKAWGDPTPWPAVETNDVEYMKRYLHTPEMVTQILAIQKGFADNLASHLTAIQNLSVGTNELRDAVRELRDAVREKK